MSKDLHFACTGCGKCCDAPPTVTIPEAMGLFRDFVLTVRLAGPIADAAAPASHPSVVGYLSQSTHLLAQGAEKFDLSAEGRHFEATLTVYGGVVRPGPDDPCPQLLPDGLCAIYERRPQRCRTVPFDYWLPEAHAVRNGAARLEAALARGWLCDVSDQAPVVAQLDDGATQDGADGFVPGPYETAYRQGLELMGLQGPALGLIARGFMDQLNRDPATVKQVIQTLGGGQAVEFSFLAMLHGLHEVRAGIARDGVEIDDDERALLDGLPAIGDFLTAQIPLIEAAIAVNLARKRQADRPQTERLRLLLGQYQTMLQANGIQSDF